MAMDRNDFFVGGSLVTPASEKRFVVLNPATEETVGSAPAASTDDIDRAVAAARAALDSGPWPRMSAVERGSFLVRIAEGIEERHEELAQLITAEMGAPISFSRQAQVGTDLLRYYATQAGRFKNEVRREGTFGELLVRREPVGVAGLIVPWNAPLGLLFGKLAPALAAGCTVVVKPSPQTPLDTYVLADVCLAAGLPAGVVNIVAADREAGEHLVRHPGVDKISFTGSTAAGRRIMSLCGEQIKRVTLELGGKSACVLLDDADLDLAVPTSVMGAMLNNGEACIALTRLLAPRSRYAEVVERAASVVAALPFGDPLDETTVIGPLASSSQRDRVEGYLKSGRAAGARVVVGGGRPAHLTTGWFVEPTVFADVDNSMTIAQEEIFGPVLSIIPYDGDHEAVSIANDSPYGLCGAVWTRDVDRGLSIARQVKTGTYNINGFFYDTTAPFGGFKQSGLGREWGVEGLDPYLEYKTINLPASTQAS